MQAQNRVRRKPFASGCCIAKKCHSPTAAWSDARDLNIASVQDTMTSDAHQQSLSGGSAISRSGGSANGSYAGLNEQTGVQSGDGGFNISVKGNTDLKSTAISSDADASRNNLSTDTLSFSGIQTSRVTTQ
jgi:filamentous hemagglutinin